MAPVASPDDEAYGGYDAATHGRSTVTPGAGRAGPSRSANQPANQQPGSNLGYFHASVQNSARAASERSSQPAPFIVREQDRDGNCLFRSFSDQLYGTPEHHALVRDRCSKYIALEEDYFRQFVAEPFDQYLSRIETLGEWGDDVEIEALSEIYDCRVEIYASYGHRLLRTFHEACDAQRPHPIRLQYVGHSHYNSLAPPSGLVPVCRAVSSTHPGPAQPPGEIEDNAIGRSKLRQEAGQRRKGASAGDLEETDRTVMDESIRLSRREFEHKSSAEMDKALQASRTEWERLERKRMDEEVMDVILQQSVVEEEQKQLNLALKESKEDVNYPWLSKSQDNFPAASSSSGGGEEGDSRDYQYPESVYAVMSMGFPLDKCIQAYHLVGDNPEGILAYCCQTLGR
eukprot:TRINITY_DN28432_c0_g1_i1.p1 TRINITY_DN28432_c0_g1~~TRINITY_DN28432_c0_g1_i1.p1  ORF type:complete len:401 (-),score=71.56 TRINITY_DN28432_c0_g1_i1:108-1310(-)